MKGGKKRKKRTEEWERKETEKLLGEKGVKEYQRKGKKKRKNKRTEERIETEKKRTSDSHKWKINEVKK